MTTLNDLRKLKRELDELREAGQDAARRAVMLDRYDEIETESDDDRERRLMDMPAAWERL